MILRRLYLYLVSAAALVVAAAGVILLGATSVLFMLNDPGADSSRGQLAIYSAMAIVALPVWVIHFGLAQRFALRDPFERASAVRRLYLYWACLVASIGAMFAIAFALGQALQPLLDNAGFNTVTTVQIAWAAIVFAAIWSSHLLIAWRDRKAVREDGPSTTLRRWYMYVALLAGLLAMLAGTASALQVAWITLAIGNQFQSLSGPVGLALGGLVMWGAHARLLALHYRSEDRHSTLRALEGFIAVAITIAVALTGASQILYYLVARALGVDNPGGAGTNFIATASGPGSQLLVYGIAWFLLIRRLTRDASDQEADRQAAIRRLYTNLAALISLAVWAVGAGGLLWTLAEQAEAKLIGVHAGDWKDSVSLYLTLLAVGAAVWLTHWRHEPWAADRQSLSRKLYVWAAMLGSILAVLFGGVGMINAVLRQAFSSRPRLDDESNLDFGHFLAVIVVAAAVGVYHWRVLRADGAARPARPMANASAKAAMATSVATTAFTEAEPLAPHSHRYTLVVTDVTDDDIHQALSNLPPQATYKLSHAEQPSDVDGH